jgi:tRNA A37 methylthiotransferase MiaB
MNIKKIYVASAACYIVQTETNHIASYFRNNGYELVDACEKADAIILTTCAVTQHSSDYSLKVINEFIEKRKPEASLYIVGCYNRIEKDKVEELKGIKNVFSVPEYRDLENIFSSEYNFSSTIYNDFFAHPFAEQKLKQEAKYAPMKMEVVQKIFHSIDKVLNSDIQFKYLFRNGHLYNPIIQRSTWPVIISKGCVYKCSYCAVRIGRGDYVSKPMDLVLNEIKAGITKKHNKILLIADEIGTYGIDLKNNTSLASLLERLDSNEYPAKFGMWYLDAFRLKQAMPVLERLNSKDKIFFLGITIQHGSERILKLMNRRYSLEYTVESIRKLRRNPSLIIATQIMVGFPSEKEEDFEKCLSLIKTGYFDNVEVYSYSPRPGTKAAEMEDDVPNEVKEERANMLRNVSSVLGRKLLSQSIKHEFFKKFGSSPKISN